MEHIFSSFEKREKLKRWFFISKNIRIFSTKKILVKFNPDEKSLEKNSVLLEKLS